MAASEHLGRQWTSDVSRAMDDGGQLVMFATGNDLREAASPRKQDYRNVVDEDTGDYRPETAEEVWDRKEREAAGYLTPEIEAEGVRRPVELSENGTVIDGHHRVAAAAEAQKQSGSPKWVPVEWTDETDY